MLITACCGIFCLALPQPEASAQVRTDSVRIYFRTSQSKFDPAFQNNGKAINAFIQEFRKSQTDPDAEVVVEHVYLSSSASPEGPFSFNVELAQKRQQAILDYLEGKVKVAHEDAERTTHAIDWDRFRALIDADKEMPRAYREQILEKLNSSDPFSVNSLRGTDAGKYLWDKIYPQMRTTALVIVWEAWQGLEFPELCYEEPVVDTFVDDNLFAPLDASVAAPALMEQVARRGILLKVNLLSLPLLVANLGVELQPVEHFSISLPIYYSGINWFKENIKFRTLAFQPELRYWFRNDFKGLFLNAHATIGWYNVAWGGDYRYQDYQQRTPAVGGGIGVGYKVPLGRKSNTRWGLEFGLGAGVLPLHYDIYYNVHNGRLAGEDRKTYWGIDQAFVSLTYRVGQFKSKQK